ncbi:hypothetical protein RIF29_14705 [Crotalaria pallida]|uniref:Uncharacterized protein n=1 Tax=Crotalaria pallida TaxID=3830 RepID=A0AAN9FC42_CROPI
MEEQPVCSQDNRRDQEDGSVKGDKQSNVEETKKTEKPKSWVEKRRPSKEDIEEIDDKLKKDRGLEEGLIEDHRAVGGGVVMLTTQSESLVEASTTHQGESSAGRLNVVKGKNPSSAAVRGGVESDKDIGQNIQWTTVMTRSKAQERYESMKAEAAKPPSHG